MTIPSSVMKNGPYACNGVVTTFAYSFKALGSDRIAVYRIDSGGVYNLLVLNTDYTVTEVGDEDGGNIITSSAYATGNSIFIKRSEPFTQNTDLPSQSAFLTETVERGLDDAVARDQLLLDGIGRALTIPQGETPLADLPTAANRANKLLAFDSLGNVVMASGSGGVTDWNSLVGTIPLTKITDGSITGAKLQDNAVTLAKMADMATQRLIGRATASVGDPEIITILQALGWITASQGALMMKGATDWGQLAKSTGIGEALRDLGSSPSWGFANRGKASKGGTDQTGVVDATVTKVTFGTENADTGGIYTPGTSRLIPRPGELVFMLWQVAYSATNVTDGATMASLLYKNGANYDNGITCRIGSAGNVAVNGFAWDIGDGTSYFEVMAYADVTTGPVTIDGSSTQTWLKWFSP